MSVTIFKNARLIDPEGGTDTVGHLVMNNGVIEALIFAARV